MSDLLSKTREICRLFEIKPARSKGQNFLINEKIYDDMVNAADLQADDLVLEVGPGLGFLTTKLASKVKKVVAVELDDRLAAYLQMGVDAQETTNIEIINGDILKFDLADYLSEHGLAGKKYKIVANLPYNISSIFLRRFLSLQNKPELVVLMLQKEVAERIVATPPDMNLLAVSVQYYAAPEIMRIVKAGNFWPEPEVDSAIIKIKITDDYKLSINADLVIDQEKKFFQIVRIGFSAKRKMLKNNLAAGLKITPKIVEDLLVKTGFNPKARAEDLSLQDWRKLFAALKSFVV